MANKERLHATAKWDGDKVVLTVNDEVVRTVTPNDEGVYRFTYEGEDFNFVYSEQKEKLYLYPLYTFDKHVLTIKRE